MVRCFWEIELNRKCFHHWRHYPTEGMKILAWVGKLKGSEIKCNDLRSLWSSLVHMVERREMTPTNGPIPPAPHHTNATNNWKWKKKWIRKVIFLEINLARVGCYTGLTGLSQSPISHIHFQSGRVNFYYWTCLIHNGDTHHEALSLQDRTGGMDKSKYNQSYYLIQINF